VRSRHVAHGHEQSFSVAFFNGGLQIGGGLDRIFEVFDQLVGVAFGSYFISHLGTPSNTSWPFQCLFAASFCQQHDRFANLAKVKAVTWPPVNLQLKYAAVQRAAITKIAQGQTVNAGAYAGAGLNVTQFS
jgi:hypothetical protein